MSRIRRCGFVAASGARVQILLRFNTSELAIFTEWVREFSELVMLATLGLQFDEFGCIPLHLF